MMAKATIKYRTPHNSELLKYMLGHGAEQFGKPMKVYLKKKLVDL